MLERLPKTTHQSRVLPIIGFLIGTLIFVGNATGQYRFDQWTADNGLPQNSVYNIKQTRDGYLWLATLDGLVRFDGTRFTIFNKSNSPGIFNNRFTNLYESANGDLWGVTEESGAVRYHQGRFTSYGTINGLNLSRLKTITDDPDGNPLMIFDDSQLYGFSNGNFSGFNTESPQPPPSSIPHPESIPIYCSFHSENKQISCWLNAQWVNFTLPGNSSNLDILNAAQDIDGTLWLIIADTGIVQVQNGKVVKVYTKKDGLPETPVALIYGAELKLLSKDSQSALWLTELKTMQTWLLTRHPPASLAAAHSEYEDREGNLWIGDLREGLFRVRQQVITAYSKADGLLENNIYPIFEDRQGTIWIGTTKGIFKYQNASFTLVKSSEDFYVDALGEDATGRILASRRGDIYYLEGDRFKLLYKSQFSDVWALYTDRENALWIGGQEGLVRLKDNAATTFTTSDGLAGNNIKVIIDDKTGGFWIGTYGGLSHYQDGKFTSWTEGSGLPASTIRALYLDADNVLWIGSYDSGLVRFKDGKFTHYTTNNGLYNDGAFQILEDDQRSFWISSNRGIYRVNKDELNDFAEGLRGSITSVAYGKSDGMLNAEANGGRSPGGIRAHDGRLWFPTQDGVAVIAPAAIKTNSQPPPVIIEDIKIDDQSIAVEMLDAAIRNSNAAIQIGPQQQNFEIQYTALSFINSENLHFKYKLEGLDNEWIDAGTRRSTYFSHIPAGNYTFRVIAANADGVWNESGASLEITILPPFYRTWWFLIISLVSLFCLAFLIYRRRVSQLEHGKKAQEELSRRLIELQENERQRLAGELHDSLSQNLVIIKNRAMLSLSEPDNSGYAFEQMEEIAEAAAESLTEVREIAANLRPFQIDRLGLTKAVQSLIRKAASPNLEITSRIDDIDGILLPEMQINLYRILQESFNNIIKHSKATEVRVIIKKTEKTINIEISDNGQGFDSNVRQPAGDLGGGFGLTGMSERARILGSALTIESTPGKGSQIRFQINYSQI